MLAAATQLQTIQRGLPERLKAVLKPGIQEIAGLRELRGNQADQGHTQCRGQVRIKCEVQLSGFCICRAAQDAAAGHLRKDSHNSDQEHREQYDHQHHDSVAWTDRIDID